MCLHVENYTSAVSFFCYVELVTFFSEQVETVSSGD